MNRVTIVNLAGRAWHVDSVGADALDAWLQAARERLADDPDRDEVLLDFERAIADRCAQVAPEARDVVSAEQVQSILDALGPVEPAVDADVAPTDAPTDDPGAAPTTAFPPVDVPLRDRKLYRLTGEGESLLGGVCAGLAAWLRVDVTVVRLLAVLLTVLTSGGLIIAYFVLWLVVPEARTPDQRAHARGEGQTAQEMLARARDEASPALTRLGSLLRQVAIVTVHVLRWTILATIWVILVAWGLALGWLVVDSSALVQAFDPGTSTWLVGLWLTCIAWIPLAILIALERVFAAIARPQRRRRGSLAIGATLTASWVLAVVGLAAIPAANSEQLAALADGETTITIDDQVICVVQDSRDADRDCDEVIAVD
jgi:phage shock protein PspC (stress-responsive transcriptional regulator)